MKKLLPLFLAMFMIIALAACGENKPDDTTPEPRTAANLTDFYSQPAETQSPDATFKKEITVSHWQAIDSIDPCLKNGNAAECVYKMIHGQLVNYDWINAVQTPDLAESWEIEDAAHYVFHLRKGVKFSNGEEMKADDVIYSFVDRPAAVQGTTGTAVWNEIEKVEAVDDYTVRFILKENDADFMNRIYLGYYPILNRKACEADPEKGYYIGTGGWIVEDFKPNDRVIFTRFDDSWVWKENGLNPTEKVTMRFIEEKTTSSIAIQNKEIAASSNVNSADLNALEASGAHTITYESESLTYMIFNMANGKFANSTELRKAVAYAINYDEIIEYATDGLGSRAYSMWGRNQYGLFEDFDEKYEYNPEKAKELLTKAGYPNGIDVKLLIKDKNVAPLLQAQLKAVGFNVTVDLKDTAGANAAVKEKDFDLYFNAITLQPIGGRFAFIPDIKHSTNRAFYDNPEMVKQFTAAQSETDDAKRKEIYKQIQIEINDEIPYLALYYGAASNVYCDGVSGILWEPDGKPDYSNIRWVE